MRIGIDIDGVLIDVEKWQLDYGSKFYFEKYNKAIVNSKGYETNEIFAAPQKYDDEFWTKYFIDYSKNASPRSFASEVIKKLKDESYEIYIITARGIFLSNNAILFEENKKLVKEWLKNNNILYDKIIFSEEDKLDTCKENNIDIMIDDKVENINNISKIIPVICFHAGYNEKCEGKNIIRAYSWYDIYYKIKNIQKYVNND